MKKASTPKTSIPSAPISRPERILVIDDDEVSLAVISMLLEAEGISVLQASSGETAIGLAERLTPAEYPQMVLADLQMPGLCGAELAAVLRTLLPDVPLVAMSATPAKAVGYNGFVRKPLEISQIWAILEESVRTEPEAATSRKDASVLDEAIYNKLSGMMPHQSLDDIYKACLDDAYNRAKSMQAAAGKSDLTEIRRHAHAIKGSAGMVGARNLAAAALSLETGTGEIGDLPLKIGNLLFCCDELKRILLEKHP